ncbi:MAG: hypothetical protein QXV62_00695, partial [Nitrososphaerota archaeon]
EEEKEDIRKKKHHRVLVQQAEEEDKTVQHILPNTQAEGIGEADKDMGDLNLSPSRGTVNLSFSSRLMVWLFLVVSCMYWTIL